MLSFIQIPSNKVSTTAKQNLRRGGSFVATNLGKRQHQEQHNS